MKTILGSIFVLLFLIGCSSNRIQLKGEERYWSQKNEGELVLRDHLGKESERINLDTWKSKKGTAVKVHFSQEAKEPRFVAIEVQQEKKDTEVKIYNQNKAQVADLKGPGEVLGYSVSPAGDSHAVAFMETVVVVGKKETWRFPQDLVDGPADLQLRSPKVHYSIDGKSLFLTLEQSQKDGQPSRLEIKLESRRLVAP